MSRSKRFNPRSQCYEITRSYRWNDYTQVNNQCLKLEEFSRRIFFPSPGSIKIWSNLPQNQEFCQNKSVFENSSRGGPKNRNGRPISAVTSFLSLCTLCELCSSSGSGVITWKVLILGVARSAVHRFFQFYPNFSGLGPKTLRFFPCFCFSHLSQKLCTWGKKS